VEQVAQRGGNGKCLEIFQGQFGWGSEQPDVVDVSANCWGVGLDKFLRSLPTQTIL